jgi:hypothetical protein
MKNGEKLMTSAKKIAANQNNAEKSSGPTTEQGKRRSKRNATKHGVLARELVVNESDKPEFEELRNALHDQLAPATTLQGIAFDRIVCAIWRQQLAVRFDAKRLKETIDQAEEKEDPGQKETPAGHILPTKWYGESLADLRIARGLLAWLREDVKANGWIHREEWKSEVVPAFGEKFFSMLTDWVPSEIDSILMAEMSTAHADKFGSSLSPTDLETSRTIVDRRLSWRFGVKLIDLMQEHLEDLARISRLVDANSGQERGTSALELANRYSTSATREVERAVEWYRTLKGQGL